jgi:aryl-alcohol dehydrogenase-like predicted oxidoreductase
MSTRRLGIGTVQFGTAYGISNTRGQVDRAEAAAILKIGSEMGVDLLDTAAAYGEAEQVVGELLAQAPDYRTVTKTARKTDGVEPVIARARESHRQLGGRPLYGLLVHSAADLATADGRDLWQQMRGLRDEGLFSRIGISAYASDDPVALARQWRPDIMQLPLSVFDQRLVRTGTLQALKECGVEIHVRSAFLQGAIFLDPARLPASLRHAAPALAAFHARLAALGVSPLEAGISYPLSLGEVDRVIVGMTTVAEAREIFTAAAKRRELPWHDLAIEDEILLDPRRWTTT